ncbi:hypothetical protein ACFWPK_14755 [Nocardia sp. NPDC058519]|uniref:hypothetical protein n=1 Tax=Nocardia sp. NPDC058519 TaxID=3346535 RepID=UPI00364EAD69
MGWDRGDVDEGTEQQGPYGHLGFLRRAGMTKQADWFAAGGPPPPRTADGYRGWTLWHEHHPSTAEELTQLVDRLLDAGSITRAQIGAHTLTPGDTTTVATLRELISAHATAQRVHDEGEQGRGRTGMNLKILTSALWLDQARGAFPNIHRDRLGNAQSRSWGSLRQ